MKERVDAPTLQTGNATGQTDYAAFLGISDPHHSFFFFFSSRRRHTRCGRDWSSDVCSSDLDAPKVNPPDYDGPDWDWGDGSLIKFFLISIAILLLVFLIYHFFFKNASKPDQKIGAYIYDEDNEINPETIQKSKLEIDLDQAIAAEDYRTAIRIYYIMLLKALIERNWIKWAKRKTNSHYSIEMSTQEEATNFNKAVLMYEWSWYGKNLPNKATFERFSTFYSDFLNRLKDE